MGEVLVATESDEVSVATELPLGSAFAYEKGTLTSRGIECALHKWIPEKTAQIRGAAVVYHGELKSNSISICKIVSKSHGFATTSI
jgi:hypothetical protein